MKKLYSIQYLRAFAALAVVVVHAILHPLNVEIPSIVRLGSFAVILFFVISGFIMVSVTGNGAFSAPDFLLRRIARVAPLYWLVTLVVALIAIVFPMLLKNTTYSLEGFVKSVLFIPFRRGNDEIVPMMKLGWTLNYEMFFYVLFAAFSYLTAAKRFIGVALVLLGITLFNALFQPQGVAFEFYGRPVVLTFVGGMAIGLWHLRGGDAEVSIGSGLGWLLAAAVFLVAGMRVTPEVLFSNQADACFMLAGTCLVMGGIRLESALPRSNLLLLLGDASYSLYLVHMYCIAALFIVLRKLGDWAMDFRLVPAVFLSCVVAVVVHSFVEKPMMRMSLKPRMARRTADSLPR
ncbi:MULTISPECIES: acyltransferase [unclassified Novosphingobium]|uniref:acyltransferase family protein n=1 Tax=unclassified Novosphingobium TaxID=2644732 RepID=UPI000F5E18C8|nr:MULTISPECIES: acyltransferase [unclassified Novosphingobium]QCI93137.1 acyltransferase [Novosphingobium sp. EMRT-2]RQW43909.1 acyltransferase [Novosphingobium sp. LASN5T]